LTSAAPQVDVQPLDGPALSGALVELSADRVTVGTGKGQIFLPTEKLLTVALQRGAKPAPPTPAPAGIIVELVDGSVLQTRQYTSKGDRAQITLANGDVVPAAVSAVRLVQLQQDPAAAGDWSRLTGRKVDGDLLVFRTEGALDGNQGVLHDVTEDAVRFDLEGEILPVKRPKVYGFVYRHRESETLPPAVCRIRDVAGSVWFARSLSLMETGNGTRNVPATKANGTRSVLATEVKLQWTTAAGVAVAQPLASIVEIDFSGGKVVYISDLKPESTTWTPYFGSQQPLPAMRQFYAPRLDRGFDSRTLRLADIPYRKGVAIHSRTEMVYRLPEGFRRFLAIAGADAARDASQRRPSAVRLVVRGDDKVLLDTPIAPGDVPRPIDVDVSDLRRLTIVVDFGGTPGPGGRLLLCNARIMK
jgi:hypothetical protein